MQVEITDNSDAFRDGMKEAAIRALEKCGMTAEGYAKKLCPVDTGNLRNSITHEVDQAEQVAYIGTNSEYGAYVELGTGKYYPGGRDTPWVYVDAKGVGHRTSGHIEQPYLKPAVADHASSYQGIISSELKGG